jgi:hypothetical protein
VVALGDVANDPTAQTLLAKIASDTGGPPPFLGHRRVAGAARRGCRHGRHQLQAAAADVHHVFNSQGDVVAYKFAPQGGSADILISWGDTSTTLDAVGFSVSGGGRAASASGTLAEWPRRARPR